jgi:hypothetical protein
MIKGVVTAEPASLEQAFGDVVGKAAEPEGGAAQMPPP